MLFMNPMRKTTISKRNKLISYILILVLFISFALPIVIKSTLAASGGSPSDPYSVMDSVPSTPNGAGKTYMTEQIEYYLGEDIAQHLTMFKVGQYYQGALIRYSLSAFLSNGNLYQIGNDFYSDAESDTVRICSYSNSASTQIGTFVASSTADYSILGEDAPLFKFYNLTSVFTSPFTAEDSTCWTSDICYCPALVEDNLDISALVPDKRFLAASKVDLFGTEYIEITTSDLEVDALCGVIVRGYSNNVGFSYTYSRNQFIDFSIDNPYSFWYLDPNDVPYSNFDLTEIEYFGSTSYGNKSIVVSLTFGVPDYGYSSDVTNIIENSYYIDTYDPKFNPGHGTIWHEVFIRANISSAAAFWDEELILCQPFKFSFIFLPLLPQNSAFYFDYLYDCANYYYDVVIFNTPETLFDAVYGNGAFQDYRSHFDATNIYQYNERWYGEHSVEIFPLVYQYLENNPSYTINQTVSMIISDSFYFKQINYLFGDTDNILIEFSSRFFEEDGFQDKLFKLLGGIGQNNIDFFNNATPVLTNLNSLVNDIRLNKYFPKILTVLSGIDTKINSIDSQLNILTSIDSRLSSLVSALDFSSMENSLLDIVTSNDEIFDSNVDIYETIWDFYLSSSGYLDDLNDSAADILEYLQNGLVSPVVNITLFDFDSINVEGYKLTEFIEGFTFELENMPFEDLDSFFSNSFDLIDSIGGYTENKSFLDHLDEPYEFQDSGVSYFDWD